MADIRDGSVNDQALREILVIEGSGQFFDIRNPDSFPRETEFIYISPEKVGGTSIKVEQIIDANFQNDLTLITTGEVIDDLSHTYFLSIQDGQYVLLQKIIEDKIPINLEDDEIILSIEAYSNLLNTWLYTFEELHYYLEITNKIHKEAVQDAVDIIQTKRLDFAETKEQEIDVEGIFLTLVLSLFFELGLATVLFKSLAKNLSTSSFIKASLDTVFRLAGSLSGKSPKAKIILCKENIALLQKEIEAIEKNTFNKIISMNFTKDHSGIQRELRDQARLKQVLVKAKSIKEESVNELEKNLKDELIKVGKSEFDGLQNTIRDNFNPSAKDVGKDFTTILIPEGRKKLKEENTDNSSNISIPMDVYFKTYIQNYYNDEVLMIEQYILIVKKMIEALNYGLNEDTLGSHKKIFDEMLPKLPDLKKSIENFKELYADNNFQFTIMKDMQTREYEFMIWNLMLKRKIKSTLDIGAAIALSDPNITSFAVSPDTFIYKKLDVSSPLVDYLSKRFFINKNDLPEEFLKYSNIIEKQRNNINKELEKNGETRYLININSL